MADDQRLTVQLIGGPTVLIEYAGLRLLTDPTFDPPGDYPVGERKLTKTEGPAIDRDRIGTIDAVLLSHQQHADNLDRSGRELLSQVPVVVTTPQSATALATASAAEAGNVVGLATWKSTELTAPGGANVTVEAVPARHGPPDCEPLTGDVTGFILTSPNRPTVYVSGDNAALGLVSEIANRFAPVDLAVLFAGAARTGLMDTFLTLTSTMAADAAEILDARVVVPAHFRGWSHFSQGPDTLRAAFDEEEIGARLVLLEPGEAFDVGARLAGA